MRKLLTGFMASALLAACCATSAAAEIRLSGKWRGDGEALGSDGSAYRVRCKMEVRIVGARTYKFNGKCSSSKGTTTGEGTLKKIGAGRYTGDVKGMTVGKASSGKLDVRAKGQRIAVTAASEEGRLFVLMRKSGE
ncbi:hypothetical protein [Dichotomicrobium thermohalophilum]|uniref:DUF3617 family protein n=1 Tax=Dichotomicrobium thermohalophilum TaxID=933063 RepID=A0A397Q7D2_9HYPH|nr:hypothetical protein [Dichotomicrobium thermohalophilum]RIA55715.1 hypothetical protein BXY53_0791 [Dichotomicrobium thermohalophilum]